MSIAEKYKAFLEEAWNRPVKQPEDVWYYTRALGLKFLEFVASTENVVRTLVGKISAIEARLTALEEGRPAATSEQPPQPGPQNGEGTNANGQPPPAAGNGRPGPDMVRINAMEEPMSPEEQAAEEKNDLEFDGKIDMTRYRPRSQFSGGPPTPPPGAQG